MQIYSIIEYLNLNCSIIVWTYGIWNNNIKHDFVIDLHLFFLHISIFLVLVLQFF